MLYVPQKGIITPHQVAAGASILVVAWVAVGGRGSLWGAVLGAIAVSLLYEQLTSWKPKYWYYVLGGLFVLVPLVCPGGLMSLPSLLRRKMSSRRGTVRRQAFVALAPAASTTSVAEGSVR
jgi:ABC-type branched-subunit amino acid transport system permease subunit